MLQKYSYPIKPIIEVIMAILKLYSSSIIFRPITFGINDYIIYLIIIINTIILIILKMYTEHEGMKNG